MFLVSIEVEGKKVFNEMTQEMPNYQFHITEGRQTQEILVGVKSNLTAFFTQRIEFRSKQPSLRPGAFLTLTIAGENYSILFLHLKSFPDPKGFGLRDDQLDSLRRLKRTLDKAKGSAANFIGIGDLNIMGLDYFPNSKDISAEQELAKFDRDLGNRFTKMRRLTKTAKATFWNGPGSKFPKSELDQVVVAKHMKFKNFSNSKIEISERSEGTSAEVDIRGWPEEPTYATKGKWIENFSDHALLFMEVQKV